MGKVKRVRLKHNEQIIHMIDSPQGFYAIISPFANIRLGGMALTPKLRSKLALRNRLKEFLAKNNYRVFHWRTEGLFTTPIYLPTLNEPIPPCASYENPLTCNHIDYSDTLTGKICNDCGEELD